MEERVICNFTDCKNLGKKKIITNRNFPITDKFLCQCCTKEFCSDSCLVEHVIERDRESRINKKSFKINKRTTKGQSIFIKPGKMLNQTEKDEYYDMQNFQKVKINNRTHIVGSGAFGEVYLAIHKKDKKYYAIKQLDKKRLVSAGINLDVVYREINIHLRLIHDHIARLYSYHEDSQAFYLILEYVENGTLFNIIQNNKGMPEEDAFKYFIQVASALQFLHTNNLIHRDLKPENCLIDKNGNVKVCDFGWTVENDKSRLTFCGTYEYMAPEIIKELPYNSAIDIWSLGILLYELIHSYSPFRARRKKAGGNVNSTSLEVLQNIINNNYKIDKNISQDCQDLIYRLLSQNSEERIIIQDIFYHPWVKNFEKEISNSYNKSIDSSSIQKQNTKVDENDTTCINELITGADDLFNNVLSQIQGKNKKKRKSLSNVLKNSTGENNKQLDEEKQKKKNKIVLKVEKVDKGNVCLPPKNDNYDFVSKNSITESKLLSPIKQVKDECDESTFSMFKEMREIDSQLNATLKKIKAFPRHIQKIQKSIDKSDGIKKCNTLHDKHIKHDSYNGYENEKTQPTINNSNVKYDNNNSNNNLNEQIFFGNKLRESNQKFKKVKTTKNLKDVNKELESLYASKFDNNCEVSTNEINTPLNIEKGRYEISTQTENKNSSCVGDKNWSFFGFLKIFKCG